MKKRWKGAIALLAAAVLGLTACGSSDSSFTDEAVLRIDGEDIMRSEYMVYLYTTTQSFVSAAGDDVWSMDFDGQTADELLEDRTILTLQSVKAAQAYAAENGIALTDEQKTEAQAASEQFIDTVSAEELAKMGVDAEQVEPLMEASYLFSLVYETIAAEVGVDEAGMEAYYEENREQIQADYTTLDLQTILLDDADTAQEVADRAKAGEDFRALFDEYDIDPAKETDGETGETTMYQSYLAANFGISEAPEAGDITGPIQVGERYFVLKTVSKTVPDADEVREIAENSYRSNIQTEYAENRMAEMVEAQQVEKIDGVWDTLEKFH